MGDRRSYRYGMWATLLPPAARALRPTCDFPGQSAQPWVSMRLLTVSPRSGQQKKLQIRDVREAAAARCAGLAVNVPTSPGLRRLALGYTLSPATRVPPTEEDVKQFEIRAIRACGFNKLRCRFPIISQLLNLGVTPA